MYGVIFITQSSLELEKLKATLTVYFFFFFCTVGKHCQIGMEKLAAAPFHNCFAGRFSICGRTPQAARHIWFIHNRFLSQDLWQVHGSSLTHCDLYLSLDFLKHNHCFTNGWHWLSLSSDWTQASLIVLFSQSCFMNFLNNHTSFRHFSSSTFFIEGIIALNKMRDSLKQCILEVKSFEDFVQVEQVRPAWHTEPNYFI